MSTGDTAKGTKAVVMGTKVINIAGSPQRLERKWTG
jgi:hypothetical protein